MAKDPKSRIRTRDLFVKVIRKTLESPEKITVSEWAEKYRVLDESSNFSGKWTNDITPYLVGIMDAFNNPYIQEINFCKSTQVGGTEAMINMLGYIITHDPAPTMIVYPTEDLAKEISKDRLQPSLKKTPKIAERFFENSSKELNLKFRGMHTYLTSGGTPSKLSSKAIKYLFFDEIDKLPGASKKEASPYNLARERTRTFTYSKKILTISTPTLQSNYVWQIHEAADEQYNYFVPCPHCGKHIIFRFKQIIFDDGEGITNAERAKSAMYYCQECGCAITDKDKINMLRKGEWRDIKKTHVGKPRKVSFWINALYSRFLTWAEIALEFLESKDDSEKLQNFVNSWLAEPWEDTKLKTSADTVMDRQTDTPEFVCPEWTRMLTGGVDVQENCLYWTIRAWGNNMTSQNIAHGQAYNFGEVERLMNVEYKTADGKGFIVQLGLIDSGDQTDDVYDFCAKNAEWVLPCKGQPARDNHYKISTVNKAGSKAYGMQLILVDGGKYKDMIAARMRRENGTGAWMVHKDCDRDYAEQVTAEHKISERTANGRITTKWILKSSHADNHYLDAEVYCMAAADMLGVRTMSLQEETPAPPAAPAQNNKETPENPWLSGFNGIKNNDDWI